MVSGSLALLLFIGLDLPLGSRAVEVSEPQAWLAVRASGLAGWASGLAGWASGLAGWPRGGGRTSKGRSRPIKRSRAREPLTI